MTTCKCCGQVIADQRAVEALRVDDAVLTCCNRAFAAALSGGFETVDVAHLILELAHAPQVIGALERMTINAEAVTTAARAWLARAVRSAHSLANPTPPTSPELKRLIALAETMAEREGLAHAGLAHVGSALAAQLSSYAFVRGHDVRLRAPAMTPDMMPSRQMDMRAMPALARPSATVAPPQPASDAMAQLSARLTRLEQMLAQVLSATAERGGQGIARTLAQSPSTAQNSISNASANANANLNSSANASRFGSGHVGSHPAAYQASLSARHLNGAGSATAPAWSGAAATRTAASPYGATTRATSAAHSTSATATSSNARATRRASHTRLRRKTWSSLGKRSRPRTDHDAARTLSDRDLAARYAEPDEAGERHDRAFERTPRLFSGDGAHFSTPGFERARFGRTASASDRDDVRAVRDRSERMARPAQSDWDDDDGEGEGEGETDNGTREKRFYLALDDDIVRAPSIGPKTAARLNGVGLLTVRDLLTCDCEDVARRVGSRAMTAQRLRDWQAQARLVCTVPWLRGTHAQLMVGANFRTVDDIVHADPGALCAAILRFATTRDGQSILRAGPAPDLARIATWVAHASAAEPARAA